MKKTNLSWGDTGPRLLTAIHGMKAGLPESLFYPVHFDDYYKVFLPKYPDECSALCTDSYALHLWNNRVVKMGLFKRIGPPAGSFLHQVFARTGANSLFREFYPTSVMRRTRCTKTRRVPVRHSQCRASNDAPILTPPRRAHFPAPAAKRIR